MSVVERRNKELDDGWKGDMGVREKHIRKHRTRASTHDNDHQHQHRESLTDTLEKIKQQKSRPQSKVIGKQQPPAKSYGTGRIGRISYFVFQIQALLIAFISMAMVEIFILPTYVIDTANGMLAVYAALIPAILLALNNTRRRLNDMGFSNLFAGLMLIPGLNAVVALALLTIPGSNLPNQYGNRSPALPSQEQFIFVVVLIILASNFGTLAYEY